MLFVYSTLAISSLVLLISGLFKFKNSRYFKYVDWPQAAKDAVSVIKNQVRDDLKIPLHYLTTNPLLLFLISRLAIITSIVVLFQLAITLCFIISYFTYMIYNYLFKIDVELSISAKSIKLIYLTRAAVYDIFINVPKARAFSIFYLTLRYFWNCKVYLQSVFKFGYPLISQTNITIGPLSKKEHINIKKSLTKQVTIFIVILACFLNFLIIKLPFVLVAGISYYSFIITCKFIYNSHFEHCFLHSKPTARFIYEHVIIHGVLTMVDVSHIYNYKITAKLVQADCNGNLVFNDYFPQPLNDSTEIQIIKPILNDLKNNDDPAAVSDLVSTIFNSYFSNKNLLLTKEKQFSNDSSGGANISQSDFDFENEPSQEALEVLRQYNEYLSEIKTEDFLVYTPNTKLQYRLEFNPGSKIYDALYDIGFFNLKNSIFNFQFIRTPDFKQIHPCIAADVQEEDSSGNLVDKTLFTGFTTSRQLPLLTLEKKLIIHDNHILLPNTVNLALRLKQQYLTPMGIADRSYIVNNPDYTKFIVDKELVSSIQNTIYRHTLINFKIGDYFGNYHLRYDKKVSGSLFVLHNNSIANICKKLKLNSNIFKKDVIAFSKVIDYFEKEGILTKNGITELKTLSIIAVTNKNDVIYIPKNVIQNQEPKSISHKELSYIYENNLQDEHSIIIHEVFNNMFGTDLDALAVKDN